MEDIFCIRLSCFVMLFWCPVFGRIMPSIIFVMFTASSPRVRTLDISIIIKQFHNYGCFRSFRKGCSLRHIQTISKNPHKTGNGSTHINETDILAIAAIALVSLWTKGYEFRKESCKC